MHIKADSLDDLLQKVFRSLIKSGNRITPGKGAAREIIGTLLTLKNPLARFSRTESRAILFSSLGELLWYLSGSNDLEFIKYYIPTYPKFSDNGITVNGAYGPRIFNQLGKNQWETVTQILRDKTDSRQAVIQIFGADDLTIKTEDVPCTCTIQFFARRGKLHMMATMRSNDVYLGLPHDVFSFTMMQEIMARSLGYEVGVYNHAVGSLHLYDEHMNKAEAYLNEGWQTPMSMPSMPSGDPWPSINWLLTFERSIRSQSIHGVDLAPIVANGVNSYWIDLARILRVKALLLRSRIRDVVNEKNSMASKVYAEFIRGRERSAGHEEAQPLLPLSMPLIERQGVDR